MESFDSEKEAYYTVAVPVVAYSAIGVKVPTDFDFATLTSATHPDFDFWGEVCECRYDDAPKHNAGEWEVPEDFAPQYFEEDSANVERGITPYV